MGGAGLLGLSAAVPASASEVPPQDGPALQTVLERYDAFGVKASGGSGDTACGTWLEETLTRAGYVCRRQTFEAPYFESARAVLSCGDAHADVIPQAIVRPTGAQGLTAPLRLASDREDLSGAIAVIVLPYKRWASLSDPQMARPLSDALQRRAAAIVLVTTGPSGEAIALNVSTHAPAIDRPVAVLAPKDAQPFLDAARQSAPATLILDGTGGGAQRRPAFNVVARRDRKAAKTLVLSTPRSGWFDCVAERGSGLAIWLSLAHWLARLDFAVNIELLATSGHEYDYLGGEHYLADMAPAPPSTKLWVHIGASAATRDWHELGSKLLPLPSADAQRVLTATADILESTKHAFRGIGGLEQTYLADKAMAGGELVNVVSAGYPSAMGLYGAHRYFHTRADDLRCTSADLIAPVAAAYRAAISAALTRSPS
jgi:hypothetical protein